MAKLPSVSDLGGLPSADVTRPVADYSAGAAAIAQGGQALGRGLQQLGGGMEALGVDQQRFDYAKAHAQFLTSVIDQNAQSMQDPNYGPDASGKSLVNRHADAIWNAQSSAANLIPAGPMRDRFMTETGPQVAKSIDQIQGHARTLENNANVAYVGEMGDKLTNQAIAAPDDATRAQLIDTHNQLVDGLVSKGALMPVQGLQMKQAWARQYATADLLHRADTDPQGVINELRAAPESGDAITNRIIQVEGTGKNPLSTANGVGQFTDSTWGNMLRTYHPEIAGGKSDAELAPLKADRGLAREMVDKYRQENEAYLQKQGLQPTAGADYLAHFLGPAGAAAVLKADPNMPVSDALTAAVGAKKAQAMIAANGSILQGQLAGSVKQWADAKMGGQTPGGGSVYDILNPAVREELITRAQAQLDKRAVADRAAFGAQVQNATEEAFNTGSVSKPLALQDFIAHYGASDGQQRYQQYDVAVQTGRTINAMATMSSEDRAAVVDGLMPQPGDPNYALKVKAHDIAQAAAQKIDQGLKKDPAGYAASHLPASKDAYAAFQNAVNGPDADRAAAAQKYAASTLMEQGKVGVAQDMQRVVPQSYADHISGILQKAATSDDPTARVGLIQQVQREASMWGQYWPQVMRQLAPQVQPAVRAIAAGADPNAMTRLLSLDPKASAKTIVGEQNTTKLSDLTTAVNNEMAPFRQTLVGRQLDRDFPGYNDLAERLGAQYVRDGKSASDAAHQAFQDLIGNRYDFRDTYRIPKSSGVQPDDVQAGAAAARSVLASGHGAGGSEDSGLTPQQVLQRNAPFVADGAKDFTTKLSAPDETAFRNWVKSNGVAFDPEEKTPDYDMRGFWKALQSGDPKAKQALDSNDGRMHFPDYWKTPYDLTFSRQSRFANASAPDWNDKDQLVATDGKVVFDDRNRPLPFGVAPPVNDMPGRSNAAASDLAALARDGKWVTAPDNSGLNLVYGDKFVRRADGKPLQLSWQQLAGLGKQQASASASAMMGAPIP